MYGLRGYRSRSRTVFTRIFAGISFQQPAWVRAGIENIIWGSFFSTSPNSNIFNNTFDYNQIGIKISTSNCNIYSNFINHSISKGIYALSGTVGNTFYLNDKGPNTSKKIYLMISI
jgi:hypothetical protein